MPIVAVTRLRLRDHGLLDDFFAAAVALVEQAKGSPGNVDVDALAEANDVWWSATAWADRSAMESFVGTDPHHGTMDRLDDWCDEATFVDWEQPGSELPGWQTAYTRLVADGEVAALTHASDANATRAFPAPVEAA